MGSTHLEPEGGMSQDDPVIRIMPLRKADHSHEQIGATLRAYFGPILGFGAKQLPVKAWTIIQHLASIDVELISGITQTWSREQLIIWRTLSNWCNEYDTTPAAPDMDEVRRRMKDETFPEYHRKLMELFYYEIMQPAPGTDDDSYGAFCTSIQNIREEAITSAAIQRFLNCRSNSGKAKPNDDRLRWPISSSLRPCPWLKGDEVSSRAPTYLWSLHERRTVRFEELDCENRSYTCISHTWGRGRKIPETSIAIDGVPWSVPENVWFDVKSLPQVIAANTWPTDYIWLDLLCIPQDASQVSQRDREIAKQAGIFRNAYGTIVWMHDVPSWTNLLEGIDWLVHSIAEVGPFWARERMNAVQWKGLASRTNSNWKNNSETNKPVRCPLKDLDQIGICSMKSQKSHMVLGWFSSLWTLQEAFLCPSALLVDQDFNVLKYGHGSPIPLDSITTLVRTGLISGIAQQKQFPPSVQMLSEMVIDSGLVGLTSSTRLSIVIAASRRYCESSRAEAIMSALGCTEWYEKALGENKVAMALKSQLVFGIFPLAFIAEVARKVGCSFYMCSLQYCQNSMLLNRQPWDGTISPLVQGSMLPIRASEINVQISAPPKLFDFDNADSSYCEGWHILTDGSVFIQHAAIFNNKIDGIIDVFPDGDNPPKSTASFQEYLILEMIAEERFAVVAGRQYGSSDTHEYCGVVLDGYKDDESATVERIRMRLKKIASFHFRTEISPEWRVVDWVVI